MTPSQPCVIDDERPDRTLCGHDAEASLVEDRQLHHPTAFDTFPRDACPVCWQEAARRDADERRRVERY